MEKKYIQQIDLLLPEKLKTPLWLVQEFAIPYLRQGRNDYDEPHTKAVNYFASKLARATGEDELVLRTAAWLHDVGYYDVLHNQYPNELHKELHMRFGVERAIDFFQKPEIYTYYSEAQIFRILRVIGVHDDIDLLSDRDEIIFMEADVLGGIVTDSMHFADYETAINYMNTRFYKKIEKFNTSTGKKYLQFLLPRFIQNIEKLKR